MSDASARSRAGGRNPESLHAAPASRSVRGQGRSQPTAGQESSEREREEAFMAEVPADEAPREIDIPVPRVRDRAAADDARASEEVAESASAEVAPPAKIEVRSLDFWYGDSQVLFGNDLRVAERKVTAIIGPSGCGKSTHIRVYNRMFELYRDQRASGTVLLDGQNLLDPEMDLIDLRRRVGMIFQRPTPFPMSVFDNVAYGLRLHYRISRSRLEERVEHALRGAALWDEVKNKLDEPGTALSGGQQQRLCIARAIAVEPEVLLMDEPTSAVDPVATAKLEELIDTLKHEYTIVIVTHNMQQAARISDFTAFFFKGYVVEFGPTEKIFTNPSEKQTEDYITGRFG